MRRQAYIKRLREANQHKLRMPSNNDSLVKSDAGEPRINPSIWQPSPAVLESVAPAGLLARKLPPLTPSAPYKVSTYAASTTRQ